MAITYHAGRRIQGLAYTASNITKDEDFSDVWNGIGSNIAITNGELVATSMQSSGDNRVYRHLGFTLVDTAWVLRFEYTPTSSSSGAFYMPIALTAGNGALSASADALRLYIDMGSYTAFFRSKDGSTEGSTGQTVNLSAGTKYYFTVVNNNRSLTATIRTGSHSGSVFSTRTATIQSGVTGLDHIQSGASSFNGGTNTYTVDNIEIWNNMTSISGTATFTENFSSSDIWTQSPSDSQFAVSSSDGRLDFLDDENSTGDRTWYDLGTDVSTTQWILRFKFRFTTLASGTYYYEFDAGLSDTTVDNNTNQNFIGVRVLPASSANLWRPRVCDGSSSPRTGATASITQSFSTGTDYFAEIKRTSASNWSISLSTTNAYDGDLQNNSYTDASGATGLRYLKIGDAVTNTTAGADMEGYIDDVEFYNDTTTAVKTAIGDEKPTNVQLGSRLEETDTRKMYYRIDSDYVTDKWFELGTVPYAGGRGVFAGGYNGSYISTLDYVTIATLGNATDFGDLSFGRFSFGSCANQTRGLFMGGAKSGGNSDSIDYITIATLSDSTDFGDIVQDGTKTSGTTSISNNTRGFVAGGESSYTDRIAYVTIDTLGNTTDFGNLTASRKNLGSTNNDTRAVFIGGEGSQGTMDYITMANTPLSNATTFGTLTSGSYSMANGLISNGTRGVFGIGGGTSSGGYNNIIEYITIATTGNSTDFGNLTEGRSGQGQSSSATRGLLAGGKYTSGSSSVRATIDYITIDTTGNATDFGDLTQARSSLSGLSDTGALRE